MNLGKSVLKPIWNNKLLEIMIDSIKSVGYSRWACIWDSTYNIILWRTYEIRVPIIDFIDDMEGR